MKKLFKVIFISLFSLLFFMVFLIYRENDLSNMHNLFGLPTDYQNGNVYFNQPLSEEEQERVIQKVKNITSEQDVIVIFNYNEMIEDRVVDFNYYVSGDNAFVEELVPLSEILNDNFSDNMKYLSTAQDKHDENQIEIFSFYNDADYTIYPIDYIFSQTEALNFGFNYYFVNEQDFTYFSNLFDSEFQEFNIQLQIGSYHQFDSQSALVSSVIYISFIMFALSIIYVLFQTSYSLKEIAVLKLNGYRIKDIISYLFKDTIQMNFVFAFLIPVLLIFIVFQTINLRIVRFLGVTILFSFLIAIFYFLAVLVGVVLVKYISLNHILKDRNINKRLANVAYITLILTSAFVLPMMSQSFQKLMSVGPVYVEISRNLRQMETIHYIKDLNNPNREWEFNSHDYFMDNTNEQNDKQAAIYHELDELGYIYRLDSQIIAGNDIDADNLYLSYSINQKYFNEQFFSINGQEIHVANDNAINVFMDVETFKNDQWGPENFTRLSNADVEIYLFDYVDYLPFDQEDYRDYSNASAPIFIYTTHSSAFMPSLTSGGIYFSGENMPELSNYLKKADMVDYLIFASLKDDREKLTEDLLYTLRQELMTTLPGLLCIIVLFISFRKFVLISNTKKWMIFRSIGYRRFDITKEYLVELVLLNAIINLIHFVVIQTVNIFTASLLLVLSVVSYIILNRAVKKLKINRL